MVNLFAMRTLLRTEAERLGVERQESNMRVAWEVLRASGPSMEADKLKAGNTVLDGDTELVDRITDADRCGRHRVQRRLADRQFGQDGGRQADSGLPACRPGRLPIPC